MRLLLFTTLALAAFAANSVLTRAALALNEIGPSSFMAIRLVSGALMLMVLLVLSNRKLEGSVVSALALLVYVVGFSFAYVSLDTGTGALILFGGVQITMFAGAVIAGETPPLLRWISALAAMAGLGVLFLPGAAAPSLPSALLMGIAAIGWGVYSLRGRKVQSALADTTGNFVMAAPIGIVLWLVFPSDVISVSNTGIALAIASGALASGLGYALWYAVLPAMDAALAAILQLTVPLIALGGGMVFLGEPLTPTFIAASVLILGGVALSLKRR